MARKNSEDRSAEILNAAAKLVGKIGAKNITRRMVAEAAKVSPALVAHYFGPIDAAQKKFRAAAKKQGIAEPAKDKIEAIGLKLRKKPRKLTSKAAAKKVAAKVLKKTIVNKKVKVAKKTFATITSADIKAIKDKAAKKSAGGKKAASASAATPRKRSIKEVKAIKDKAAGKRTAARAPKAPPALPPLPTPPALPPLPNVAD